MPETIYARKDIANTFGVTPGTVSNWIARYDDWPQPQYTTPDGVMYWTLFGLNAWLRWHSNIHQARHRQWPSLHPSSNADEASGVSWVSPDPT